MRTVERVALQSILHLKLYANAGGQHMRTRKLNSCSVSALFFPVKTLLNQSWAVSYPLAHKRSSMWTSVAVSAILLSLSVSLVLFSTVKQWPGTVLPPCGKTWLLQNNFSAHVRPERTKHGYKNRVVRVLFWWRNSLSLAYAEKVKYTLALKYYSTLSQLFYTNNPNHKRTNKSLTFTRTLQNLINSGSKVFRELWTEHLELQLLNEGNVYWR